MILPVIEVFGFFAFSGSQSAYVAVGLSRLLEVFAISEVVLGVVYLVFFGVHLAQKSTSCVSAPTGFGSGAGTISLPFAIVMILPMLVFALEKAPFDVIEAESELIDGVTTELPGFAFSLTYAAEVACGFLGLKFVVPIVGMASVL